MTFQNESKKELLEKLLGARSCPHPKHLPQLAFIEARRERRKKMLQGIGNVGTSEKGLWEPALKT